MLKKTYVVAVIITFLTACSSTNIATFKISDIETKKWIEEGNKAEQCLFYKQWKQSKFNGLSDEEHHLYTKYVHQIPLIKIIGLNNFQTITRNLESQQYTSQQYLKFNHSNKTDFDKKWCDNLKSQYKQELSQIRIEIKQQKAQAEAQRKAELARQKQAEKERKAREAYLRTPAGQAELARQQQLAYQQQMLAQQQAYQQQMLEMQRQAAQQAEFQQFSNQLNSTLQGITRTMQQSTQMYNNATSNMRQSCQNIGQGWGTGAWQNVCY